VLVLLTGAPLDTEQPGPLGHTEAPYSRVGSIERDTRDTEQPGPLGHTEAPYSRVGSIERDTRDTEQPGLPGYPGQIGEGGLSGS